jgi:ABC-type oligopeptide transport system ATPase subunit
MSFESLVQVRHLTRDCVLRGTDEQPSKRSFRAVADVTFAIDRGAILGIVGESGCGKSTLAWIIMALDRSTGGDVVFEGDALFKLPSRDLRRRRRDSQMVLQDP